MRALPFPIIVHPSITLSASGEKSNYPENRQRRPIKIAIAPWSRYSEGGTPPPRVPAALRAPYVSFIDKSPSDELRVPTEPSSVEITLTTLCKRWEIRSPTPRPAPRQSKVDHYLFTQPMREFFTCRDCFIIFRVRPWLPLADKNHSLRPLMKLFMPRTSLLYVFFVLLLCVSSSFLPFLGASFFYGVFVIRPADRVHYFTISVSTVTDYDEFFQKKKEATLTLLIIIGKEVD